MKLCYKVRLTILLVFSSIISFAQELTVGDRIPDIQLTNYATGTLQHFRLSDAKAKLIILDFWGTGCTSCIQAFSKIDLLQKKFGGEVQFILVNKESPDSTKRFFLKRKQIKPPAVPMVMGDSVLHQLFPHVFVPHHVWLDSVKSVKYITDGWNATERNINDFLEGYNLGLALKKDMIEFEDPLIRKIGDWKDNVLYYSALTKWVSGLTIGNGISSTSDNKEPNRICCTSSSITQLFQRAFAEGNKYNFEPGNTIILDVKDKWKFTYPENKDEYGEWLNANAYYYELVVPPSRSEDLYKTMQKDLLRYFNVDVRVEKRKIKCLVLINYADMIKLKTKGGRPETNFSRMTEDSVKYIRNLPFDRITSWITRIPMSSNLSTPIINLVKYNGNVDFEIKSSLLNTEDFNLPAIRKELQKYGLDLVERFYLNDVLIISDHKTRQE